MDSFDNIPSIVGSRRPILVPALSDESPSSSNPPTPPSTVIHNTSSIPSSRSRRKPAHVFKSPSADDPGEWEAHSSDRKRATPYKRPSTRRTSSSTETTRSSSNASSMLVNMAVRHNAPVLPLYHPLGPLAQSLPKLDPSLFGLPSSLNIDDGDDQAEGDSGRSSSRARRAAPKGRETGEDDAQSNGTPNGTGKAAHDAPVKERNASPRKRRGGGGGGKRKRKDTDDADGVFPPPAKRTRNPRGAAANSVPAAPSPLVGPAVVASDLVDEVPENSGEVEEEAQEEVQPPKRSSRTRKPRTRPAKRRDSSGSASTATSVSVSIATTAKGGVTAKAAPQAPSQGEGEGDGETLLPPSESQPQTPFHGEGVNGIDKLEERETEDRPQAADPPAEARTTPTDGEAPVALPTPDQRQDITMNGVTLPPAVVSPTSVSVRSPPPPLPPPQKEEREEGELSDDGPKDATN